MTRSKQAEEILKAIASGKGTLAMIRKAAQLWVKSK